MFTNEMKIMLYVDGVEKNAAFWRAIGFKEIDRQEMDGTLIVEIAQSETATASLVLYDREFIEQHSPEVAGSSPSLMFYSENVFELYKKMQEQGTTLGDLVQLGEEYVFNFADPDGNYFAVTGKE
ncbi:glyoxalase [Enterococcus villorum]|uniref:Glyoxalase n=1 Tax=Enterococcus villorum TaxID=112904 RepID=A0A1V8YMV5_9ENTE|nr:VOC family protein [Enterococcus villorum]OQO71554.1 glyoxalase [Enterococcus villorum]OQO73666.1 glyoxalase [Enterococcus villorum]